MKLRLVLLGTVAGLALLGSASAAEPFPKAKPEDVGLSSATLNEIVRRVKGWVDDEEVVGAEILVIKNRKTVLHEAVGWKDLDERLPVERGTIVCVRSMTKPLVGTAVQMLVDEGKLGLDDRVSKYLPSFDNAKSKEVTLRQLLTHTAGFPLTLMNKPHTEYKGVREVADQAGSTGPGKAGTFSYSDTDSDTLAALAAQVSGKPIEKFLQDRILKPLGMKDTYPVLGKEAPPRKRVSSNHAGTATLWHKYWDRNDPPFFPYFLGGAALYSTPADYARFLALWMDRGRAGGKRLLTEAAVKRGLTPAVRMSIPGTKVPMPSRVPGWQVYYGQHWMLYGDGKALAKGEWSAFGHGGSDGTHAWAFPEQDLIVLYFTQSRGGLTGYAFEEFLPALLGNGKLPDAPRRLSAEEMKPYLGSYQSEDAPSLRPFVVRRGKRLGIEFTGQAFLCLRWPDRKGHWPFDEIVGGAAVEFRRDDHKAVTGFDLLTGKDQSAWKRVSPGKDLPTATALMAERRKKQGGQRTDALDAVEMKGTFTIGSRKGDVTLLAAADGRLARRIVVGSLNEVTLANGKRAWKGADGKRFEPQTALFLEQVPRLNPLVRAKDWRKNGEEVEVIGKERVGKEDAWVVRAAPRLAPSALRYVGVESGLLLKEETWLTVKGLGTVPFTLEYQDYREVAGVRLPFRVISRSRLTGRQVMQITEAKANPKLPDGAFAPPKKAK
jgi:CubicO group peptidase (beta-lactamase class C family)